ncbi:MAG: FAD-dependent oxidoreductase [Clostridia bacterium]|nr:FAD-dependent oxidoreductase [Clostridia bacterium]
MQRKLERYEEKQYEIVVVGGGMSGVCAAISAARNGAKVALVHARSMLGGNASSEIRIHISGADQGMKQADYAEGGLLYELMLENKSANDYYCYSIWDMVLHNAAKQETNLDVYYDTVMYDTEVEDDTIKEIYCVQSTTEMRYCMRAPIFIDCTGNGTLGYYAGAEYTQGSEAASEYNEPHAPAVPNNDRMGNTILLKARNMGHPVKFVPPACAKKLTEEQLKKRIHCASMRDTIDCSESPDPEEYKRTSMISSAANDYGYWWLELMGESDDIITEHESIRDDLIAYCYGLWDHIKNNDEGVHDHGAENYALEWVGCVPGTRESRRLIGDYILSETDILAHKHFDDAICYGGWCIDLHAPHGLLDYDRLPSDCNYYQGVYGIPYRSYYSKNIKNLYMAGRNISTTRLGLASTRIIGCCAIGGEAVGIAAAMCAKYGCTPRELSPKYIHELQQRILKADGYLPNVRNCDPKDLAREAEFDATSYLPGGEPAQVKNGISRKLLNEWNAWISAPLGKDGEMLTMRWSQPRTLSQLRLTFWSDFNYPIRITMAPNRQKQQRVGVPAELIKDYTVRLKRDGKTLREIAVRENHQRLNVLNFESTECDLVEIAVHATNGHEKAVIFEVRAYGE